MRLLQCVDIGRFIRQLVNVLPLIVAVITIYSCRPANVGRHFSFADSIRIIRETLAHRAEVDSSFRFDPESPFRRDSTIHFDGIKWFPPSVDYYFEAKLNRYSHVDTVIVMGTKGEARHELKYGYFSIPFAGNDYRLNVYKEAPDSSRRYALYKDYLSVWFTDETTGKETYAVGRYLDVGIENIDPQHTYVLNLNNAYNPYCAYSRLYSCAIPRREDHLGFAVRAGELKYHQ